MSDWSDLLAEFLGNDKGNDDEDDGSREAGVESTFGLVPLPSEAKTSTPSIPEPLLKSVVSAHGREYMEVAEQATLVLQEVLKQCLDEKQFQANQEIVDT
eukprot:1477146-Amphidinium_carterae.1